MENQKSFAYVCRKCKKVNLNVSYKGQKCLYCKEKLERLPISVEEWNTLSESDKENYVNSYLSQVEPMGNKYVYKSDTPLAWHKYNRYFRAPVSLIILVGNYLAYGYSIGTISIAVLTILFVNGSSHWERYAYKSIIAVDIITIFRMLITCLLSSSLNTFSSFIGVSIIAGLEIYYYTKREKLFNGSKDDPVINFEFKQNDSESNAVLEEENKEVKVDNRESREIEDANNLESKPNNSNNERVKDCITKEEKVKEQNQEIKQTINKSKASEINKHEIIKFCKNCGIELNDEAKFCRNCGTKIK